MNLQNDRLLERVFTSFKDCNHKVETCIEFSNSRHSDLKKELFRITGIAEAAVDKTRFAELSLSSKALKT